MKKTLNQFIGSLLSASCLTLFLGVFALSTVRAGLNFELHIYQYGSQNNYTYYFDPQLRTNSTGANVTFGNYAVASFGIPTNGSSSFWQYDVNGFNQTDGDRNNYSDFNSMVHEITNGVWSLFVTNATITNVYHFKVALNISSNNLPKVLITAPLDGAVNVTNQPMFIWQGPTNYSSLVVSEFNTSQSLPVSQTSWLSTRVLYQGPNNFNVEYLSNSITAAVASIPTNSLSQTFSGWVSTNILDVSYGCQFSVGLPDTSGSAHALVAHYPFDATSGSVLNAAVDTSGNGLNMTTGGTFGSQGGDNLTSISATGIGAVLFQDGDNNSGAYLGWTEPTPPALLSTLAGSFSVSCWIKTTQNIAWNTAPAYVGAGIVSADNFGQANDVVPIALTGSSIGFNTGGSEDVTLNSVASVNDGNYHHIVVTRNQVTGQKIIYIDGQFDSFASGTTNLLNDVQKLTIGALANAGNPDPNDGSYYQGFDGELDDLQIYSGVLSASDVTNLFANPGSTSVSTDFNAALDTTNLNWTTSGDSIWFIETTNTSGSGFAAQSGSVTGSQSSTLSVTVTGPGTLTFYWSSIANDPNQGFDCEFALDGSDVDDLYGNTAWYQDGTPFIIPPGQHTLTWTAYAYGDTDPTEAAFLDQVTYVENTSPVITLNPFSQTNYPGYNVALFAAATGSTNTVISWEWFKVGNPSPIANATNALFIPANSGTAGVAGSYYAVANSPGGSANTTTAVVSFVTASLPPNWTHALKSPFQAVDASTLTKDYYLGCAVDAAGDVYAAAQYIGNMKVITNGITENILITTGVNGGSALVKHAANANPLWAVGLTNNSAASYSYGSAVAVAPGNGAYLASNLSGTNWLGTNQFVDVAGASILLSRFDAIGSNVWSRFIGGTNGVFTTYNMLVSDSSGNVTLAAVMSGNINFGGTNLFAPSQTGCLVQYDTNGVVRWAQVLPDTIWGVASGGGLLYASLQATVSGGVTNISIASLSNLTDRAWGVACLNATNGQAKWLRGMGEAFGSHPSGIINDDLLISVAGTNVFVMANTYGNSAVFGGLSIVVPGGSGQYLARYDTNGTPYTATAFGSPTTMLWASAADASGVYVCGDFDSYSQFGSDIIAAPVLGQNDLDLLQYGIIYYTQPFVTKFDANGNTLWARNGVSSDFANLRGIATTSDGVWAAGFLKITNGIPAQFDTFGVLSDPQTNGGGTVWNQSGLLTKITDSAAVATSVTLLNPQTVGANFQFQFLSEAGFTHNILYRTNLAVGTWQTNFIVTGNGTFTNISVPYSIFSPAKQGFIRVSTQ
jgi:hypothetical protein